MKVTERSNFHVAVALRQTDAEHLFPGVEGDAMTDDMVLIVRPKRLGDLGIGQVPDSAMTRDVPAAYLDRCADMAATLRQLPHVRSAVACWDEMHTCSHCELRWEVTTQEDKDRHPDDDSPVGMPVCCEAAQAEWLEENAALCTWIVRHATLETPDERCDFYAVNGEDYCAVHQERADALEALVESTQEG